MPFQNGDPHEAARVHYSAWRRGDVADGGAGAAARADAAHRRAGDFVRGRSGSAGPTFGILQGLQQLGWADGRNVRIDTRWTAGDPARARKYAAELVALEPDVILAEGTTVLGLLLQATRPVPIVFAQVTDPVGGGFVASLARPGGNATGFMKFEYSLSEKWLELLKEIAPGVTRVAVLRDPTITPESVSSAQSNPWRRRSGWK